MFARIPWLEAYEAQGMLNSQLKGMQLVPDGAALDFRTGHKGSSRFIRKISIFQSERHVQNALTGLVAARRVLPLSRS